MLADHRTGCRVQVFIAWSSIAQSVCQRAFSLLANWCLGPRVQILHSAEEHNLSSFDLNIACLCQSIEINNNKYVYVFVYAYAYAYAYVYVYVYMSSFGHHILAISAAVHIEVYRVGDTMFSRIIDLFMNISLQSYGIPYLDCARFAFL